MSIYNNNNNNLRLNNKTDNIINIVNKEFKIEINDKKISSLYNIRPQSLKEIQITCPSGPYQSQLPIDQTEYIDGFLGVWKDVLWLVEEEERDPNRKKKVKLPAFNTINKKFKAINIGLLDNHKEDNQLPKYRKQQ